MTDSNLQIQLDKPGWVPGENIRGTLVVSLEHALPITRIELRLKGQIRANTVIYERPGDHEVGHENCEKSSSPFHESEFTNQASSLEKSRNHNHKPTPGHVKGFQVEVCKYNSVDLIDFKKNLNNGFDLDDPILKRGVSLIPFELEPLGDLSSCIPSGKMNSQGQLSVDYFLEASIYYPASYYSPLCAFDFIKFWWSEKVPVLVFAPLSAIPVDPIARKIPFRVGHWEQQSMTLNQRLVYMLGADTASDWYDMVLEVKMPSKLQLYDNCPELFGDLMKLKIVFCDGDKVQLLPEMEVTAFKVEHVTSALLRPTQNESSRCGQVKNAWAFDDREVLGEINNIGFRLIPNETNNLESLLRTIKFPTTNMLSTCSTADFQVKHSLHFTLKVKVPNSETDGTAQAEQTVKFDAFINIEQVASEEVFVNFD